MKPIKIGNSTYINIPKDALDDPNIMGEYVVKFEKDKIIYHKIDSDKDAVCNLGKILELKNETLSLENPDFIKWCTRAALILDLEFIEMAYYFTLFNKNLEFGKERACFVVASVILQNENEKDPHIIRSAIKQILYFFNTTEKDLHSILQLTNDVLGV